MSNKTTRYGHKSDSQIIDSLRAENAALRAEVDLLREDKRNLYQSYEQQRQQLATSQLEVERLREAIFDMAGEAPAYSWKVAKKIEALSPPTSTDALDAYVAEKVQDKYRTLRPYNGRAMSAQEHDEAVEELTRQRDLAVSAATKARNGAQQAAMVCSKHLDVYRALLNMIDVTDDALAAIKESEV